MSSRLDDIPVYQQRPVTVAAADFNRVQIALKRLGEPLQISLVGLRTLALVLEKDAWIVIDTGLSDVPVLAWTDFQSAERDSLHEDIPASLKIYHAHAMVILNKVTAQMENVLRERIEKLYEEEAGEKILPMPKIND